MIDEAHVTLHFVILGACHSETAANIFLKAGAEHVIGIDRAEEVLDRAALTFTRTFYSEVWRTGSKICKCFELAKLQVSNSHGKKEADRFKLLLSDEHQRRKCKP